MITWMLRAQKIVMSGGDGMDFDALAEAAQKVRDWLINDEPGVLMLSAGMDAIIIGEGDEKQMTEYETEKVEDLVRGMTDEEIRITYRTARDEMERRGLED